MLFGNLIRPINELEIDGKQVDNDDEVTDYTAEEDNNDLDNNNDENDDDIVNQDDLDDYTSEEMPDDTEDQDNTDDPPVDDNEDNTTDDYTSEEMPDGGSNNTNDSSNTDNTNNDSNNTDDNQDTNNDTNGDGSLKSLEKTLFADLTPEQMSIKNSELMQNFIDLHETLNQIFNNINKIPKTYNNTRVLAFISDKILDLKDMIHMTITTTYGTKTYVENLTTYKQSLLILKQIDNMLKELSGPKSKENNEK